MLLEWSGLGKTGVGRQAGHVGNLLGWDGGGDGGWWGGLLVGWW